MRQFVLYAGEEKPLIEAYDIEAELESDDSAQLFSFLDAHDKVYRIGVISYVNFHDVSQKDSPINDMPKWAFVVPKYIKVQTSDAIKYYRQCDNRVVEVDQNSFPLNSSKVYSPKNENSKVWDCSINQSVYQRNFQKIVDHLQYGDIYEMNYCIPFYRNCEISDAPLLFQNMQKVIQAPHAGLYTGSNHTLLSFSPERFLKKQGEKLISQPIKGTAPRGNSNEEDTNFKNTLINSQKEKSENVMIVDLVRNDLSRIAEKASVKVEELFGVYSFSTVHQMISTISCKVKDQSFANILKATFPMGSMTGAPKISAMNIIDKLESFNRQWYSGALGYIAPNGDFDFNVVIRSFIYDQKNKKVMCPVGSAVTIQANAEQEYEECKVKFSGVQKVFDQFC